MFPLDYPTGRKTVQTLQWVKRKQNFKYYSFPVNMTAMAKAERVSFALGEATNIPVVRLLLPYRRMYSLFEKYNEFSSCEF
jgi:hypothetical protein